MSDKPIIFSAPMVLALLSGRKTQTRRLLKPSPQEGVAYGDIEPHPRYDDEWFQWIEGERGPSFALPYAPGDRLYVREAMGWNRDGDNRLFYRADNADVPDAARPKGYSIHNTHAPSIHMPRWASRLWLEVTDVRVERAASISEADAEAEGCVWDSADGHDIWYVPGADLDRMDATAPECFARLWASLHIKPGERWQDNPWVVAVSFNVHRGNIDARE